MMRMKHVGIGLLILICTSFVGGVLGGFLGVGLLDGILFDRDSSREVILQESSVIVDMVENLEPSVVSIEAEGETQTDIFGREFETPAGSGTGVIVSEDGLVLTNRHVIPDERNITVTTSDGTIYEDVTVLERDPFNDIAYLQLEDDIDFVPVEIGDSDQVAVGQRVIAIGNALGQFRNTVTSGIISGIGRPVTASGRGMETEQLQGLFQTDAAINPGNSGGPLVNVYGQVIGINTAVAGRAENIGFAIPINQVTAGLESIEQTGRLIKPFLGIRYILITPEIAEAENLGTQTGAYLPEDDDIASVITDGPAARAGIEPGDIITSIDGQEIDSQHSPATILSRYQAGEEVAVVVFRDGEELEFSVELEEFENEDL